MQAQVQISPQAVNLLIGHTLTALRKVQGDGRKHRVRCALRNLHNAKRVIDAGASPALGWLYVNAAYWRLRTALIIAR